jgi:hypothetical protein
MPQQGSGEFRPDVSLKWDLSYILRGRLAVLVVFDADALAFADPVAFDGFVFVFAPPGGAEAVLGGFFCV